MSDQPAVVLETAARQLVEATADPLLLIDAGVPVTTARYDGTVHDFMLLNSLTDSRATRASVDQATSFRRAALTAK